MSTAAVIVAVLVVYNLIMIAIGVIASRRAGSQDDFLIGGHKLGPWVAGFAYVASTSSAWVLLGFSGFVYAEGVSALWMAPGIVAGFGLVWLWAGPNLSAASREKGHVTLVDYIAEDAAPRPKRAIAILSAGLILFCFTFYIASQLQGAGQAFESAVGVDKLPALAISAAIVVAYTFLGGFWAVSLTDTIQGGLMAVAAVLLPIAAVGGLGGFGPILETIRAEAPASFFAATGTAAGFAGAGLAIGLFATGLASLGQPHNLNWLMALKDEEARRRGWIIALVWGIVVYGGMAVLGLAARAAFGAEAPAEGVFLELAEKFLPPILAGVVIASLLSAIMSTVDAQLLVASAAVTKDLGVGRWAQGWEVPAARATIVLICIAAVALTVLIPDSIFRRVLFAWSALGAAFGPIVAARAMGWRPGAGAILAAMIVGFSLTVLFSLTWAVPGDWDERLLPWVPAMVILGLGRLKAAPQT